MNFKPMSNSNIICAMIYFAEAKAEAEKRMAEAKAMAGDKCSIQ